MRELLGDSARGVEWALVRLRVNGQRIVQADASGLERDLVGLTLLEAAAVGGETLAVDALANAIGPHVRAPAEPNRVAVAMSGGVDSAVALLAAGSGAVGVTLRLWSDPEGPASERVCCSPAAVIAARETCHRLGLAHVTLDQRQAFERAVVTPFANGYRRGLTPNPCSRCNGSFRFAELERFRRRVGAARLATGHYARLERHDGRLVLARGRDQAKDQSYMLATLRPANLEHLWFPLGELSKEETRARARAAGLAVAERAESQEACFLGGGDYRGFLERRGLPTEQGAIVDEQGQTLGQHDGYWRYTVGQRRGLGLAAAEPTYVLASDPRTNTVRVGPRARLACRHVSARGRLDTDRETVEAKLRYRSAAVAASVTATPSGFALELAEPVYGVASGQSAVLYVGDRVVGAGTITRAR